MIVAGLPWLLCLASPAVFAAEPERWAGKYFPPDALVKPGEGLQNFATGKDVYSVPITVDGVRAFPARGTPVRCGVPLPLGLIRDANRMRLLDAGGKFLTEPANDVRGAALLAVNRYQNLGLIINLIA